MIAPAKKPQHQLPLDPPQRPTCATCIFWEVINSEAQLGACRIRAPIAVRQLRKDDFDPDEDRYPFAISAVWPMTTAVDWCGEGANP